MCDHLMLPHSVMHDLLMLPHSVMHDHLMLPHSIMHDLLMLPDHLTCPYHFTAGDVTPLIVTCPMQIGRTTHKGCGAEGARCLPGQSTLLHQCVFFFISGSPD